MDLVRRGRLPGLLVLAALLVGACALSVSIGASTHSADAVWLAVLHPDGSDVASVVWDLRVPRTVVGVVAGAAVGVAGALVQALTRNPLADVGVLGINAGAGFAVVAGVGLFGAMSASGFVWFAFAGAMAATVLVYAIGSGGRGTVSPATLVLAGVALTAVLSAMTRFLTLMDQEKFRAFQNWGLGALDRAGSADAGSVLPFLLLGLMLALVTVGPLNAVALGDDLAVSLGAGVARARAIGFLAITLLAGGATALTGGLGFVGLAVPHLVRWRTGPDHRWIVAYTAVAAPSMVLIADVFGRIIARPGEIEVGLLTALLGGPVLIALVRRRKAAGL
ncbi:FecCD family ABC transporter permease [Microbacterium sp. XT11]|uniref:FecCD family ABC transporter permease n=1 Tax=Microbacterium sp. XT11 TaxID=367477 RepID=UPI000742EC5D|nr:iron chelate uptake ABC transporter family permease subunit [Microbacterium sp. XT11]ALX67197.1 ABC-type transporter,permease components [Microbacterium sp. XT11]